MTGILPTMPRFRDPDGTISWRQVWDLAIPGNAFDSRTGQWRPQGMVAGAVGQVVPFGDMAVEALYANRDRFRMPTLPNFRNPFSGFGDWLRGRTGNRDDIGRGVDTPESFYRDRQRMYDEAMNSPRRTSTERWLGNSGYSESDQAFMDQMNEGMRRGGPVRVSGAHGGFSPHSSVSSARGLGLGQLGATHAALMAQIAAQRPSRNQEA